MNLITPELKFCLTKLIDGYSLGEDTCLKGIRETSLVIQRLTPCPPNVGRMASISDWGTKIPHAGQHRSQLRQKSEKRLVFITHQEFLIIVNKKMSGTLTDKQTQDMEK